MRFTPFISWVSGAFPHMVNPFRVEVKSVYLGTSGILMHQQFPYTKH